MKLSDRQFNVLWRCFNNRSVVLGLPPDNLWYAPAATINSLVSRGYLREAGLRTRVLTEEGRKAMQADEARWLAALEYRAARRRTTVSAEPDHD
jgi:hypothetical protein